MKTTLRYTVKDGILRGTLDHQHTVKDIMYFLFGWMKSIYGGIGWFISDMKWKYILARRYSHEQCSSCFKLMPKGINGGFDYKGKTFYICRDCYDKLHNNNK